MVRQFPHYTPGHVVSPKTKCHSSKVLRIFRWRLWVTLSYVALLKWSLDTKKHVASSDPKNPWVQNVMLIKLLFVFWSTILDSLFKIFECWARIPNQRPQKPNLKCIELKEKCMLQSQKYDSQKWPKFEPPYRGRHFEFWNFDFRCEFNGSKYPSTWSSKYVRL